MNNNFWSLNSWARNRIRIDLKCWIRIRIDRNTVYNQVLLSAASHHTIYDTGVAPVTPDFYNNFILETRRRVLFVEGYWDISRPLISLTCFLPYLPNLTTISPPFPPFSLLSHLSPYGTGTEPPISPHSPIATHPTKPTLFINSVCNPTYVIGNFIQIVGEIERPRFQSSFSLE